MVQESCKVCDYVIFFSLIALLSPIHTGNDLCSLQSEINPLRSNDEIIS